MKLSIAGKQHPEDVAEFDLVHDGDDVVLISKFPDQNVGLHDSEILRFTPDGKCRATSRYGRFHDRDVAGRFIIKGVSSWGAI